MTLVLATFRNTQTSSTSSTRANVSEVLSHGQSYLFFKKSLFLCVFHVGRCDCFKYSSNLKTKVVTHMVTIEVLSSFRMETVLSVC